MNRYTLVNRTLAGASFLIALLTYMVTLQPEVPFWDCGEFSAAAAWQQVPHPPGAPLWLLVARMFHMLPFGNPGWRLNMVSAVSAALTVMLVYMIGVQLVERWRRRRNLERRTVDGNEVEPELSTSAMLATLAGPFVGALAFTWSDTNWFNAVESEVYAAGNLLIALLIWLMMRWDRKAGAPGHERYLLMMAYIMGLAIGVHLLALLVFPAIAMVIYFKHYKPELKTFAALMVITGISFMVLLYKAPLNYIPNLLADIPILGALLLAGLIGLVVWAMREKNSIVYMATMSFLLIILGYTTYTQIMIRAQAHPPMNENEPDTFAELASYLGREQYGHAPNWPRRYKFEQYHRQYQDKYGEWFPPVDQREDGSLVYDRVNASGEINFMMQYQIYHMYIRYFLWNFVGRVSDMPNAGVGFPSVSAQQRAEFIAPTGFDDVFPISFFALPLLLGIFGAYYHYKRDWKMALVFTALFLFLGLFATLQQNQQQPQPRERDYFYVGSFMVFALWIGLGATGIAEMVRRGKVDEENSVIEAEETTEDGKSGAVGGVLALCLLAVPLNMAYNGWTLHDRSGNYMPSDYAYNILQSCEKDAIVFTNGDNDTFPLWYMQDVEGVRRDVRVVNLSLGNTLWYVYQLKNERPWGALQVPISFDNAKLKGKDGAPGMLSGGYEVPAPITVPVPGEAMALATNGQSSQPGSMTWTLTGEGGGGEDGRQYIRIQDKLVADIIRTNGWKRPVYFSSSVGPDAYAGLEEYFRREGMVYRVLPVRQGGIQSLDAFNTDVMWKSMVQNASTTAEFHTTPNSGLRFRNMNDPGLFLMEDHRRLLPNYRTMYLGFAEHQLRRRNDSAAAVAVLDKMDEMIPSSNFPLPYWLASGVAQLYEEAGAHAKAQAFAKRAIAAIDQLGEGWRSDRYAQAYNPITTRAQMQVLLGDFDAAQETYKRYGAEFPGDPNIRAQTEELRVQKYLVKNDTAGAARELEAIIAGYGNPTDQAGQNNLNAFRLRLMELRGQAPLAPSDNTQTTDSGGTPTRQR